MKLLNVRGAVLAIGALIALGIAAPSSTQAADFHSPRTDALGGAGHAHPLLNDSIYLNPSFTSFLQAYSASVNYALYNGGANQPTGGHEIHGHVLNASIQDGTSEFFQAGVGLTLKDDGKLINIGASKLAVKRLGFGLGLKFYLPNQSGQSATHDMIFSSTFLAFDWLTAAFIIDNVFSNPTAQSRGYYREFILGTKINIQGIMLIYLDPHVAPDVLSQGVFGYQAGIELQPFQDLFLRVGMFRGSNVPYLFDTRGRGYGIGAGWLSPKISFDFGISRLVDPISTVSYNFGLTLYL